MVNQYAHTPLANDTCPFITYPYNPQKKKAPIICACTFLFIIPDNLLRLQLDGARYEKKPLTKKKRGIQKVIKADTKGESPDVTLLHVSRCTKTTTSIEKPLMASTHCNLCVVPSIIIMSNNKKGFFHLLVTLLYRLRANKKSVYLILAMNSP